MNSDIADICDNYADGVEYPNHHYHALADHLDGDVSPRTTVHYVRHLAYYDHELFERVEQDDETTWTLRDDAVETLGSFTTWVDTAPKERFDDAASRIRFTYHVYLSLKHYLRSMGERHLIDHLPDARDVEKPSNNPNKFWLTKQEIEQIIAASRTDQLQLAIACMFYGGMRTIELFHITPLWIDFDSDDLVCVTIPAAFAKGKRRADKQPEKTYLPRWMAPELKDFIRTQYGYGGTYAELVDELRDSDRPAQPRPFFDFSDEDEPFVPEERNEEKPLERIYQERYRLSKVLTEAAKQVFGDEIVTVDGEEKAKYELVTPHCLRRSLIHYLYDDVTDKDLNKTSQAVRHDKPETTAGYLELAERERKDVFRDAGYAE